MMKTSFKTWFTSAFFLFALTACDKNSSETADDDALSAKALDAKPRVALVMKSLANEFFINMAKGAEEHQADNSDRYALTVNGIKNESDLAQQVNLVEQMIASRMDVIVIAPANSKSLLPVIKKATDAGIVVINIDNKLDAEQMEKMNLNIPFVGPDNKEGAYKVGAHLAKQLQANDKVAIIGGIPGAFNAQQRQAGFEQAISEYNLDLVANQSASWEQGKAATVAAATLSEHPDLKAFFVANDAMALGTIAAVRQAGKTGEIKVVGFDNISAANELVQSGELFATADQHGDKLAVYGIQYALQILEDGDQPADKQTPVDLITKK